MERGNDISHVKRRRRRNKYKYNHTSNANDDTSLDINRQDEELEREVDSYLNWGASNNYHYNTRKRSRRAYGGKNGTANSSNDIVNGDSRKSANRSRDHSSLPMLLHLREIGLSSHQHYSLSSDRSTRGRVSWKSQILHEPISASNNRREKIDDDESKYANLEATLRLPVHPTSTFNSQWYAMQYSSPTYYKTSNNNNNNNGSSDIMQQYTNNQQQNKDIIHQSHRLAWRPYTQQRIPFSKLQTPHSDAILALDRWGGYLIGVGSGVISEGIDRDNVRGSLSSRNLVKGVVCPHLSIKFYGIPSPARSKQIESQSVVVPNAQSQQIVSPLIHAVPLLFKKSGSIENRNFPAPSSILGHNEFESANIPIQILLSDSGTIGVAFLHHSTAAAWSSSNNDRASSSFSESPALQDEDILGTIVIFETPSGTSSRLLTKSFRLSNVRVGGWKSFTMRNSLWPTTIIPTSQNDTNEGNLVTHLRKTLLAYMLFNDEDDGFRITWISIDDSLDEDISFMPESTNTIQPTRNDIVVKSEENVWEGCLSDPSTGCCPDDIVEEVEHSSLHPGLDLPFELYLRVDALFSDILSRRQSSLFKGSPYQTQSVVFMPDFFYNLVSAYPESLKVVIVLVFSNKEKRMHSTTKKKMPSALGVFVEVNLCDQSYDELKWVQHPSCNDASSMKQWCNSLALNWRMKQRRVGVYCLDTTELGTQMENWVCGTHEVNTDEDVLDDYNVYLWKDYVARKKSAKQKGAVVAPKDISMSSLYPHCDVVTNRAVHNAIPVKRIACRHSAIELIYG